MISNDKILSVFDGQDLTWSDHIRHLSKKDYFKYLASLQRNKFLSQEHRILFYKCYIQPHVDFCNIVWGSYSETNKQKIFRLQKKACRVILDYNVEDFSQAMDTLKILYIYDRLYIRKAKFMFKVYQHITYF